MNRKLSQSEKDTLRELKTWSTGYQPCKGADVTRALDSLVGKSYATMVSGVYFPGLLKGTEKQN